MQSKRRKCRGWRIKIKKNIHTECWSLFYFLMIKLSKEPYYLLFIFTVFFMEYMQMHRLLKNLKDIFGKNGFFTFFMVAALLAKLFQLRTLRSMDCRTQSLYSHTQSCYQIISTPFFSLGTPVELIPYDSSSINKTISILCVCAFNFVFVLFVLFCFYHSLDFLSTCFVFNSFHNFHSNNRRSIFNNEQKKSALSFS